MSKQKKCSIGSVIGGILCMIFIPVIVINLTLIISTYTKPGEMPGVFGVKPAIVLSGSMEPEILTGDMIFLHKTDPDLLQTGDVICYLDSGRPSPIGSWRSGRGKTVRCGTLHRAMGTTRQTGKL